ncbi:TcfC E-set like domain-containing protein [Erwinia sp. HR93]|uniref:TcfC E-set like domain-containing protein n=1 Tax=Erwinia sp. HR93 TaxID=3094840 RepID=UPI002ADEF150|nr:TcfC E-set like domain-containing protein [Erwinia sp. HR93]MEA1063004.1 TcfC E-set like domain-containing protein [Erwinia sp. HR93]
MSRKLTSDSFIIAGCVSAFMIPFPAASESVSLPKGFEDIFNQKNAGIFEIVQGNNSLGSLTVEYDRQQVWLTSVQTLVEKLYDPEMPSLTIPREKMAEQLSHPIRRVSKVGYDDDAITIYINESNAIVELILPEKYLAPKGSGDDKKFIVAKSTPGFVHNHYVSYLSDSYGDSLSVTSNDTLGITKNSYISGNWNYSKDYNATIDELALNIEQNTVHYKFGRQRLSENLLASTPSANYSFFSPVSLDGVSLGYMSDNYIQQNIGAASPVNVYLPEDGSVEVYRNGRLIDMEQFSSGLHQLNTDAWPSGGYDIEIIVKLVSGTQQRKVQPFYKRSGSFRAGDVEYSVQLGRYDQRRAEFSNKQHWADPNDPRRVDDNYMAAAMLGYTTESATSLGSGLLLDDDLAYLSASLDTPLNFIFAERFYLEGLASKDKSYAWLAGFNKSYGRYSFYLNYRSNRYQGPEKEYQRFGIVPSYDYDTWQLTSSAMLPWNVGLSLSYGLNTFYHSYGRQDKSRYESWDVNLSRDFNLFDDITMRTDVGYHQGINDYRYNTRGYNTSESEKDRRVYAQLSFSFRERSYNHSQTLFLRGRMTDNSKEGNTYGADYNVDFLNPEFDRAGKYTLRTTLNGSGHGHKDGSANISVDNNYGLTSASYSKSFGHGNYSQKYLSQRGGFAIGDGNISMGRVDTQSALIVDATDLPKGQYFNVRNRSGSTAVVEGGEKTTLSIMPYQKIVPEAEQVYTGKENEFFTLSTKSTSTWIKPGQVYTVKLEGKRNQTVTGRIYFDGRPLTNARVVGGNTVTDEEGLFVGDFSLATGEKLTQLSVKQDGVDYVCPLNDKNSIQTHGVMQVREVNCEIK